MLFFHKILNVSSLNFNLEVRITTHVARISFSACNNEFWNDGTREGWTRIVQAPRTLVNGSNLTFMELLRTILPISSILSLEYQLNSSKVRKKLIIKLLLRMPVIMSLNLYCKRTGFLYRILSLSYTTCKIVYYNIIDNN